MCSATTAVARSMVDKDADHQQFESRRNGRGQRGGMGNRDGGTRKNMIYEGLNVCQSAPNVPSRRRRITVS